MSEPEVHPPEKVGHTADHLSQAGVDELDARVAQGGPEDLDVAIVAVEADLGEQDTGSVLAHSGKGLPYRFKVWSPANSRIESSSDRSCGQCSAARSRHSGVNQRRAAIGFENLRFAELYNSAK